METIDCPGLLEDEPLAQYEVQSALEQVFINNVSLHPD